MKFTQTPIDGAYVIDLDKREDDRGYLERTWDRKAFEENGIHVDLVEGYVSLTRYRGTIRGLHYQVAPHAEAKLVRCLRGSYFEVIADVRPDSETYGRWFGVTVCAGEDRMVYIPPLCAHAVLTLEDRTELQNFSSVPYAPEAERGIRYDDPFFNISWPAEVRHVSSKDAAWEDFHDHHR
ncbi:MAG TPA: dTDP-4-dehydrorhamnose 3,5-epimerase family protein [Dehalococcoidia bacterium]|jgi:dTDP-4-dehydrorhamnose 3,5-epimerase|nr:dTDP-4-dehydrorhamnose 3,5-epimerase family protein [Dehalococcoidia bacterium]